MGRPYETPDPRSGCQTQVLAGGLRYHQEDRQRPGQPRGARGKVPDPKEQPGGAAGKLACAAIEAHLRRQRFLPPAAAGAHRVQGQHLVQHERDYQAVRGATETAPEDEEEGGHQGQQGAKAAVREAE